MGAHMTCYGTTQCNLICHKDTVCGLSVRALLHYLAAVACALVGLLIGGSLAVNELPHPHDASLFGLLATTNERLMSVSSNSILLP